MKRERSIRYNFILNLLNTVMGVIFPIITLPYISRVIGPEGLGIVSFNQAIIHYIILLSSLGIATYAVREVSRLRGDDNLQLHCSLEILELHLLLTVVAYCSVFALYFFVPQIRAEGTVFLILSIPILFNAIGVVWFFQAREDFQFILVRSFVVKVLAAIAMFAFVTDSQDVVVYASIVAFAETANNFLNFIRLRKIVNGCCRISWKSLRPFRHLRPTIAIFAMSFFISLYLDVPSVFLGFISGEDSVGYYVTASRLTKVILSVVTALGTTLLPRMSHYFASGEMTKFRELERTGLRFIIGLTLPISIALAIMAREIIICFAGGQFEPSIDVLRIISPTIIIIGIAGIIGFQSLYPQGKERIIIKSAVVGFVFSTLLNVLLTPVMAQNGASIAYLSAEAVVTISMIILGRHYLVGIQIRPLLMYLVASILMAISLFVLQHLLYDVELFLKLIIEIAIGFMTYSAFLLIVKDDLFIGLIGDVVKIIKR